MVGAKGHLFLSQFTCSDINAEALADAAIVYSDEITAPGKVKQRRLSRFAGLPRHHLSLSLQVLLSISTQSANGPNGATRPKNACNQETKPDLVRLV